MNSAFKTLLCCLASAALHVAAQSDTAPAHNTVLGQGAFAGSSGRLATNMASGSNNLQSNHAAIAVGPNASAVVDVQTSFAGRSAVDPNAQYNARIESQSLAGTSGLISINQVSGSSNAQTNLMTLVIGEPIGAVGDGQLSRAAPSARAGGMAPGARTQPVVALAPDALVGSRGVVQINQIAGGGNASVIEMTMRIAPNFNVR
jgi:hypothetical protein